MRSILLIFATALALPTQAADLIVTGARIWTAEAARPWAEAMATAGERVVAVGSDEDIRKLAGANTRRIDGRGQMVVPGFIDCHAHLISGGQRLSSVQLRDLKSREGFVARLREFAAQLEPGEWITGGDWDHTQWGGELPRREWIDAVTPNNPVWVHRLDGHMALANTAAIKRAGVDHRTPDIAGGTIVRDEGGAPTGIFKDNAMQLIARSVPEPSDLQRDRALEAAMDYVAAQGVTSVHHMGSWNDLATFRRAHAAGKHRTRIYAAVPLSSWRKLSREVQANGRGDAWLRIGGLKGFVDGSLGSHTAALLEPYDDSPNDRGLLVNDPQQLRRWVSGADQAGLQVMIHAIGDHANRILLDIFERVAAEQGSRDRRFRIEHAQHLAPADIPRFGLLQVIASMQPYHTIDDGRWAESRIGAGRAQTSYAFRSLLDRGAKLAFGSDWFVAPATPREGIYAAVTRRTLDGKRPGGWVPAQRITVEEALYAYTRDAAFASFEEDVKGTLAAGKLADFVILDRDVSRVSPAELRDVQVLETYVGGQRVFPR